MARAGATALMTAVLASTFSIPAAQAAPIESPVNTIDTSSRAAVTSAYLRQYTPAKQTKIDWTGSVDPCNPGTQSPAALTQTLNVINFYRGLNKLDAVVPDPYLNNQAQAAALMMQANQTLNHNPDPSFKCYSPEGASAASRSNLFGGQTPYMIPDAAAPIDAYMTDPGDSNTTVGHRRWLLNPKTMTVGVGTTSAYNAVTLVSTIQNPEGATPEFMAFPSAGYFPTQLEPNGRWSLSSNTGVDFSSATVAVSNTAGRLNVAKISAQDAYGIPNTIVFKVDGLIDPVGTAENVVTVTVDGMKRNGVSIPKYSYSVKLFDPNSADGPVFAPSIRSKGDVVAVDTAGRIWDYGTLNGPGEGRRQIGSVAIPKSIYVTDWNADGVQDLLIQEKGGALKLRKGKSTGGFDADIAIGAGWQNYDITIAKWKNTDKYPTIIGRNNNDGGLFAYTTTNGTSIAPRTQIGAGWKGFLINAIDWDKDGNIDILAKNSAGEMKLYRTNGAGKFLSEARKTVGTGWNPMTSIKTTSGRDDANSVGIIARNSAGNLYYYQVNKGTWGSPKLIGSGWNSYTIAGNLGS